MVIVVIVLVGDYATLRVNGHRKYMYVLTSGT